MAYTGETLDVGRTQTLLKQRAAAQGFQVDELPLDGDWPLLALHRKATLPDVPRVLVGAGIHGDEPAGPLAVLKLLTEGALLPAYEWVVFPMMSPDNLAANRRENPDGRDPNRDYRDPRTPQVRAQLEWLASHGGRAFDTAFLLHEDWEAPGYYLYELCSDEAEPLASVMLKTAASHFELHPDPVIEGLPARGALISFRGNLPERPEWPEAIYLAKQGTRRAYTMETPSSQPLQRRVDCHAATLRAVWDALKN